MFFVAAGGKMRCFWHGLWESFCFVLSDHVDGYVVLCELGFVLCTWKLTNTGYFKNLKQKEKVTSAFLLMVNAWVEPKVRLLVPGSAVCSLLSCKSRNHLWSRKQKQKKTKEARKEPLPVGVILCLYCILSIFLLKGNFKGRSVPVRNMLHTWR